MTLSFKILIAVLSASLTMMWGTKNGPLGLVEQGSLSSTS